ncbi:CocE/NonD family hydrolase [Aquisalimonas sp.]|uniref:CocE/NonD family hydrolase n=1 Tax=Aquisalimonas sp. TaxID=1872621 RepID=UPI0025BDDDC0|nr:CocE/NonD family hydrolase [Aquisalimonas sp.]
MIKDEPECPVKVIEHIWITMPDGCTLATKLWLPEYAEQSPVPAIVEYIPYRKRDVKAVRDATIHGYFAAHGYACLRVDLRGSGDSDGLLHDEYLPRELADGVEIIRWLTSQPWCNGRVGLMGISWGGFNALQIAALDPPGLAAIITVCSSDDRYTDDVHYMGGCLLTDNLSWASIMFSYNASPPDPELVGERWRDMWMERLQGGDLWLSNWLRHQCRDDYWKHGSVCENYAAVKCPVFAVSGWADGYCNTVFRLMAHLDVPRKGLVGPWGHKYPHMGGPGPAIDFLGECLRWWDHWLKGVDTGEDGEPMLRAWMQNTVSPISDDRPGRWVAESQWPSPNVTEQSLTFSPCSLNLLESSAVEATLNIASPLSVGLFAGKWCSYAESTDLPTDQRLEDGGSLVFDSPRLEADLEILGAPVVDFTLSADKPRAMVAVRLSDVGPGGTATLITYGLLNLCHRQGHEQPIPLQPGRPYQVSVRLNHVAQCFPAGHRIRIAVSSSYWPLAWPAPEAATLTFHTKDSRLILPVRAPRKSDNALRDLGSPQAASPPATTVLAQARREWTVQFNLATNEATLQVIDNDPHFRLDEIDLLLGYSATERFTFANDDYTTLCGEVFATRSFERGDWRIRTETRTVLTSTQTHYRVRATLDAYEGDTRVFCRNWDEWISRECM